MTYKRKLIEVALPLDAINAASQHEKSVPLRGHPATLHLWWARRPLAAARAVLWSSLVDDPSAHPDRFPSEEDQDRERQRLFEILEELVKWENSNNKEVLEAAKAEILASCDGDLPNVLDPFCGGGTIPLEAQRLGLPAYGGDLNPVAVLISKAMVEIPARFAGMPPVNPESQANAELRTWDGTQGLADDIRYYGQWMRDRAFEKIGHLYPKVMLPQNQSGGEATVIAWIWARTVTCGNPSCGFETPLLSSYVLSSKKGRETFVQTEVEDGKFEFHVTTRSPSGQPRKGLKRGQSGVFECVHCGTVTQRNYVAAEGEAGRIGVVPVATVLDGGSARRVFVDPVAVPHVSREQGGLAVELTRHPRDIWCHNFGLHTVADLFTDRQLVALDTFISVLTEAREQVRLDTQRTIARTDRDRMTGYENAVLTYLALAVDKLADWNSSLCTWIHSIEGVRNTFARQALPMTWDFVEINPFSDRVGNIRNHVEWVAASVENAPASAEGEIRQVNAAMRVTEVEDPVISTDPPYYDNIGYSDLSDFFYVVMRQSLRSAWPDEFSTVLTPKADELVADSHRTGSRSSAEEHFESGMSLVLNGIRTVQSPNYPSTIFYAFKQEESDTTGTASTGWEKFLSALVDSGVAISATWPVRTERVARTIAVGTAALASSIVIACRPRPVDAPRVSAAEFLAVLRGELPDAIRLLQTQSIAPVDMAQSAIGPGMAVFSRYSEVVEADGEPMSVRRALILINEVLQEVLSEEETEFDGDTRWALTWFEQNGLSPGPFGDADTLSKAKNTAVKGVVDSGIAVQREGKVRLKGRDELVAGWDPSEDPRPTVWEATQHLIAALGESESEAADLLGRLGTERAERARQLSYLLYQVADRKGWAEEAVAYNGLVQAWTEISRLSGQSEVPIQPTLGE